MSRNSPQPGSPGTGLTSLLSSDKVYLHPKVKSIKGKDEVWYFSADKVIRCYMHYAIQYRVLLPFQTELFVYSLVHLLSTWDSRFYPEIEVNIGVKPHTAQGSALTSIQLKPMNLKNLIGNFNRDLFNLLYTNCPFSYFQVHLQPL